MAMCYHQMKDFSESPAPSQADITKSAGPAIEPGHISQHGTKPVSICLFLCERFLPNLGSARQLQFEPSKKPVGPEFGPGVRPISLNFASRLHIVYTLHCRREDGTKRCEGAASGSY